MSLDLVFVIFHLIIKELISVKGKHVASSINPNAMESMVEIKLHPNHKVRPIFQDAKQIER